MGMDARRTETTATCLHVGGLPLFSPVINAVDTSFTRRARKFQLDFFPPLFEKLSPHYFNLRINRVKEKKRNKIRTLVFEKFLERMKVEKVVRERGKFSSRIPPPFSTQKNKYLGEWLNTCRAITERTRVCCFNALRNNKPSRSQCFLPGKSGASAVGSRPKNYWKSSREYLNILQIYRGINHDNKELVPSRERRERRRTRILSEKVTKKIKVNLSVS